MSNLLKSRMEKAFTLTGELVAHLEEAALRLTLPGLPSNPISGQIWCIVGARESYLRAIEAGGWQGFSCGLNQPEVKAAVLEALDSTRKSLDNLDFASLNDAQLELAFALLEHEIQHHGQLIRYVYGNKLTFPVSWNKRYTV